MLFVGNSRGMLLFPSLRSTWVHISATIVVATRLPSVAVRKFVHCLSPPGRPLLLFTICSRTTKARPTLSSGRLEISTKISLRVHEKPKPSRRRVLKR